MRKRKPAPRQRSLILGANDKAGQGYLWSHPGQNATIAAPAPDAQALRTNDARDWWQAGVAYRDQGKYTEAARCFARSEAAYETEDEA